MESQFPVATREELWRLQEDIKDLFVTQGQHSERIMKLEKRRDEDTRVKNVWGPVSPFPGSFANSTQQGIIDLEYIESKMLTPVSRIRLQSCC
jgi:hypothetical protein